MQKENPRFFTSSMEGKSSVASSPVRPYPPYQTSRLQSKTYQHIIQIFSAFHQHSHGSSLKQGQNAQETEVACSSNNNIVPENAEKQSTDGIGSVGDRIGVEQSSLVEVSNLTANRVADDSGDKEGSWRTYEKFMLSILSGTPGDGTLPGEVCEIEARDIDAWTYGTGITKNEVKKTKEVCYSDIFTGSEEKKASTGVEARVKRKHTTKERSEKKKAKRRKKRAEQDRQAGVKRLKLEQISKMKVVNHCKFYLNGKCQQGDACNFSHDTTPLTKAKPCNFLALNKCLKGDDCPYDHNLSKYPCNNFKTQGFCPRGDSCLFSHKVPLMNDPCLATDVHKVAQEFSSLQVSANSVKQPHTASTSKKSIDQSKSTTPSKLPSFKTITRQSTRQDVIEVKPPAQAPKGISFLSFGKTQCADSSKQQQSKLPTTRDDQSASEKVQHSNEILEGKPAMVEVQDKNKTNSAQKALSSTSLHTSNCDSKVKNPSLQPFASDGNIPTVSSILQEFLFNVQ